MVIIQRKLEPSPQFIVVLTLDPKIKLQRIQNMTVIDDSLDFMDEIISIITGETESRIIYNDKCRFSKSGPNLFLNREI